MGVFPCKSTVSILKIEANIILTQIFAIHQNGRSCGSFVHMALSVIRFVYAKRLYTGLDSAPGFKTRKRYPGSFSGDYNQ
jgi:hypothetical protein